MVYLYKALTGLYSLDMERAQECLDEADVCTDQFADYVDQYMEDAGCTLGEIDIVSLAYQYIAQCAGAASLNDYLYSNSLATRFDISPDKAKKILRRVPKNQRNEAWLWLQRHV